MSALEGLSNVTYLVLDVTNPQQLQDAVELVRNKCGGSLDILINNAGSNHFSPVLDLDLDETKKIYDINVWGPLMLIQKFAPLVISAKRSVINITSISGYVNVLIYFGDNKALYSITLAGETLCVITGANDIQELYRNSSTITWDNLIKDMYSFVGLSPRSISQVWGETHEQLATSDSKNPTQLAHEMTSEYHRQQLLTAVIAENLVQRIIPGLDKSLPWNILSKHPACIHTSGDSITLSLWEWCNEVIIKSSVTACYGHKIFEINPNLLQAMMSWEAKNWKFMYKLPEFIARDIINARSEFIDTLCKYFETPKEDRSDALYFVKVMEEEIWAAGLSDHEIAGIHMLHLWAITANVYKAAFWAIAHIVHIPELLAQIRAEIAPAMGTDGETVDLKYLTEDCPRLEAFFHEVLRINSAGALAREVTTPTLFSGNVLAKGTKLMIPYRQLPLDGQAWGPSARDFDPERFLKDKSLTRSPNFRPFGGGHKLCPGRFIAKKSVYTIVALLFSRYDVTLETSTANQKFPRIDDVTAGVGTNARRRCETGH
ncbi:hypothetical protein BHYA_0281g00080 [Botrytis hyacinthi]|uniref:Cytochrome P450 n=1 Tax=Botrytis hyacinthi TaxID=278943 RepID=A0A4Z1G7M9_9HELO|nr:hypothetical protein BHYA_0281g00080 [Botrytis hyacinthi]